MTYLLADIGGTNTRVALANGGALDRTSIRRFRNDEYTGLPPILAAYKSEYSAPIQAVCVDLAGPVEGTKGRLTNRDWIIETNELCGITGASHAALLNDMQAQAHSVGHIATSQLPLVRPGKCKSGSPILIVNVGTGLNIAMGFDTPNGRLIPAAEAGHISLPIGDETSAALADYIRQNHGFAAVEEVLSGRGLSTVYRFVTQRRTGKPDQIAPDEILNRLQNNDPDAMEMAKIICQTLGRLVGDYALIGLPYGGIYLVGGVARALLPYLSQYGFNDAFIAKGRFSEFMTPFEIRAITDDYAALTGCAAYLSSSGY
jgi:glucokinase